MISSFAEKQLKKYGWTEGEGLGKKKDGMKKAITIGLKQDNGGVGADANDWGFAWWDHVFNKATSAIQVEAGDTGDIRVVKVEAPAAASNPPSMLYGSFVKQSSTPVIKSDYSQPMTDEELLAACEGRRAGKGARVDQSGKLKRISEYEKKQQDGILVQDTTNISHVTPKRKRDHQDNENEQGDDSLCKSKSKKDKKKSKSKSEKGHTKKIKESKKSKKKKKSKKELM